MSVEYLYSTSKTMKSLSVIFVLLFVGSQVDGRALFAGSSENSNDLDADDLACISELHLDKAKIEAVDMEQDLPEDENFTKFMSCTGKRKGLLKSDGKVDFEKIKEEMLDVAKKDPEFEPVIFTLYKGVVTNAIDSCQTKAPTGANEGVTIVKTLNCITDELKEMMENLVSATHANE